jgi:dTDP-4-amino-4,6-dideoxygalactose transaminase
VLYLEDEIALIREVMRSTDSLTQGRATRQNSKAPFHSTWAPHIRFLSSAARPRSNRRPCFVTLGSEDEVAIPNHILAWFAVPFVRTGAKIVWADIAAHNRVVAAEAL